MSQPFEPTLASAARSHASVVVAGAVAGILLAWLASITVLDGWSASSSVLVEDPRVASVFEQASSLDPRRFVADQVAILESPLVARRAADMMGGAAADLPTREVLGLRVVSSNPDSGLIDVSVQAGTKEEAVDLANAFINAYQDVAEQRAEASFERAVTELDSSIEAVDDQVAAIDLAIAELSDPGQVAEDLLAQVLDSGGLSAEELARLGARLQALQLSQQIRIGGSEVASLLAQRQQLLDRRTQLQLRHDQVSVDAAAASTGVVLASPAEDAEASPGLVRLAAIGLLLGLIAGVFVAYRRSLASKRFENRREPEAILGAPMFAEVPDFSIEAITGDFPIRDRPLSAAAEAYRFAGAAISDRAAASLDPMQEDFVRRSMITAVTSSLIGDGKTVTAANVGAALATKGKRVLLIDADFGSQALTKLIADDDERHPGLTDMAELGIPISAAVRTVHLGDGLTFDLLSRGNQAITAPEFFRRRVVASLFAQIKVDYDLILVDVPPMLQVAYSASIVHLCDSVLVVVSHGAELAPLVEAADRVALTGKPIVGYVYNRAPMRPEMQHRHGSMQDPLGLGTRRDRV